MIILDKHLKRKGDLPDSIDPLIIQDSKNGQDTLQFKYPVDTVEKPTNTLRPFLLMTLEEADNIVP